MVTARRRFLSKHHFDFLIKPLVLTTKPVIDSHVAANLECNILDVGCGDGYFLAELARNLTKSQEHSSSFHYYGMDLSKDALKVAASKHHSCQFFLANVHYEIPVRNQSAALITNIFAPRNFSEYSRILTREGKLVIVIPNSRHLNELRNFVDLLKIEENKEQKLVSSAKNFELVSSQALESMTELERNDIIDLMNMTPNFWHKMESAALPSKLSVTFSFQLLTFKSEL